MNSNAAALSYYFAFFVISSSTLDVNYFLIYYAQQLYRQVLLRARISYGNSVRPSVRLSRPGTESSPGEIETPGLHRVIA